MNKIGSFLKKVLIVICIIAILTTCVNYSVKFYRKSKMEELIAIVTDEQAEVNDEVINEIYSYIKTGTKIDSYEEYFLVAYLNEYRGQYNEALDNYLKVIDYTDQDEQIALVYSRIGIFSCKDSNYKQAKEYLLKSLELQPNNNDALLYLAESYLQLGNYTLALENVNKYASNNDLSYAQYEAVLTMYINIAGYKDAINTVNTAIEKYPDKEADLILYRLQTNILNNDMENANIDANRYCEITENEAKAELIVASYCYALGLYQKALDIYTVQIKENKEYNLLEKAIECAYQIDDYETMYDLANIAINHYEKDEQINYYKWQGIAMMQLGNYYGAVNAFNKYLEANNEHYEVIYLRALCYFTLANYNKAIEDFTKTINSETLMEDSLYNRALCYVQINDIENTKKDLEAVKQLNSGSETYNSAVELLKLFETEENKE